jgi:hypothetical protein
MIFFKHFLTFSFSCLFLLTACAQNDNFLQQIMMKKPEKFGQILRNPEVYEVQIIYTQIDRDATSKPTLKEYTFRENKEKFFSPASLVKMPVMALSLEKLNNLKKVGVNKWARMGFGADYPCQTELKGNDMEDRDFPCLTRFVEGILAISENEAYSRLYEFLGQRYIYENLERKGYTHTRILRRFGDCSTEQNRHTNSVTFYNEKGELIYTQPAQVNENPIRSPLGVGKQTIKHYAEDLSAFEETLDYDYENFVSLRDANDIFRALIMPEAVPAQKRFNLNPSDYKLLLYGMGMHPHEARLKKYEYDDKMFPAYKKYLYYGRQETAKPEPNIRIFNMVGWWNGYVADCAYIIDTEKKVEFFVSAVVYTTKKKASDTEFNDYKNVCFPFLGELGKLLYEHEMGRVKKHLPTFNNLPTYKK